MKPLTLPFPATDLLHVNVESIQSRHHFEDQEFQRVIRAIWESAGR